MQEYSEFTLCNWKKWDLIRYIREKEKQIDKVVDKIQELYLNEEITYSSRDKLLKVLAKRQLKKK